ncbi:cellulase family glycosylhydrolase [bacterium]|nr:cellulase family glycosylhydrolase [bacterium]
MKYIMMISLFMFVNLSLSSGSRAIGRSAFTIKRGTNISHWLSQVEDRHMEGVDWFTEADAAYLAGLGFDHVRIPVDEARLWDEQGQKIDSAFAMLNQALDWCSKYGLRSIVDLHILRSHHFNAQVIPLWEDSTAQEHFFDLWRDLSMELRNRPVDQVAYELMNEAVAHDPDDWNRLLKKAWAVIREHEPERVIVIGSNRWQIPDTFDVLKVPENDPNIILSFHFYIPMPFTHYRATWWRGGGEYAGPVKYPGQAIDEKDLSGYPEHVRTVIDRFNGVYNPEVLETMLHKPLTKARELDLPLYCGEWGSLPTTDERQRLAWYADMRAIFEKNGIAWATWDYQGDFGLREKGGGAPKQNLIRVLVK